MHRTAVAGLIAVLLGALPSVAQPEQTPADRSLYFSDCNESPGSVYRYDGTTGSKTTLYTRPSGRIYGFAFAPWDPDRLYLVDANRFDIIEVVLGASAPTETVVHSHDTYARDIAFDEDNRLYFSESTGSGGDGKIWRIDEDGTASVFVLVRLSEVGGFWAGNFAFAPDGKLLVSSGNVFGASLYELDVATGTATELFDAPGEAITGFVLDFGGVVYSTNNQNRIYNLDLIAGTATVILDDPSQERICEVNFQALRT